MWKFAIEQKYEFISWITCEIRNVIILSKYQVEYIIFDLKIFCLNSYEWDLQNLLLFNFNICYWSICQEIVLQNMAFELSVIITSQNPI